MPVVRLPHPKNLQKIGNVLDSTAQAKSSEASIASAGKSCKISVRRGIPDTAGLLKSRRKVDG